MIDQIKEIEKMAKSVGTPISAILVDAGVSWSTWHRWKKGQTIPNLRTLEKIKAAIKKFGPSGA